MNIFILKNKLKPYIFILLTALMPFLDDHSDKIITAFMAIFAIEEGANIFKGKDDFKEKK